MNAEQVMDLKERYKRWTQAKEQVEFARVMNLDTEHKSNFEKLYKLHSQDLVDTLIKDGYTTREQMDTALKILKESLVKPKLVLKLIKGGKK